MNKDPRVNPETSPIVGHSERQPFARRSITTIFFLVVGGLLAIYFLFSWLDKRDQSNPDSVVAVSTQMPGNRYEKGSARGGLYNIFYKVFGGIEDGLEDNPHNLNNVSRLDDLNLDTTDLIDDNNVIDPVIHTDNAVAIESVAANTPKPDDGYKHSAYDIIGGKVQGVKGENTGTAHDILINKKTGEAKGIVLNEDGIYYDHDLKILKFKNVMEQESDGDVRMLVTEDTIENRPDFDYNAVEDTDYISLRKLRESRVMSHSGEVVGLIDAVIYKDAEAQSIYFNVKQSLQDQNTSNLFKLPYDAVQIVKGDNGYYIQLTEEQTLSLINE